MNTAATLQAGARRDRAIIALAIAGLVGLAWYYLVSMASDMSAMGTGGKMSMGDMASPSMPMTAAWSAENFIMVAVMWAVMMVGMMLPSAAPMIMMFTTVNRRKRDLGRAPASSFQFVGGYIAAWVLFSVAATALQWGLQSLSLLTPMMNTNSAYLGGGLFIAAGIYQLTPLKHVCLRHCRSPLHFILHRWRDGALGAFRMGAEHGAYCLGCCWFMMALLFVLGVMNIAWIAGLAALVMAEKVFPKGAWLARAGGVAMLGYGVYLVLLAP